jgi:methyl-accepting chemotaxis protein
MIVLIWCLGIEYLFSGYQLINIPIIIMAGIFSFLTIGIWTVIFDEIVVSSIYKECKKLLSVRKIPFEESPLFSLRIKFKFFSLLIGLILLIFLLLVQPLELNLIALFIWGTVITWLISEMILFSIYRDFKEIKESVQKIKKGEEPISSFSSLDEEILDLSQTLNETAREIRNYQKILKEKKASLEIKVKAKTKELEELTGNLDQRIKERTKEIQERVDELEKIHQLTISREIKMTELKGEIKKLTEKNKALKEKLKG